MNLSWEKSVLRLFLFIFSFQVYYCIIKIFCTNFLAMKYIRLCHEMDQQNYIF